MTDPASVPIVDVHASIAMAAGIVIICTSALADAILGKLARILWTLEDNQ